MTVGKTDILKHICLGSGLTKADADRVYGLLVRYVQNQLLRGEKVNLAGLGAFEAVEVREKAGRNPKTGERMQIPRHRKIRFTPSSSLKLRVSTVGFASLPEPNRESGDEPDGE